MLTENRLRTHILFKSIAIALVCLFVPTDISWAQSHSSTISTLAPLAGSPQVYSEMRHMMQHERDSHQKPIDTVIERLAKNTRNTKDLLSATDHDITTLREEFMVCIKENGALDTLDKLKITLRDTGGRMQVIFVKSEDELPVYKGKKVWGHAGKYVTVFALENELASENGRQKIIGRFFHEMRARSTSSKKLFNEKFRIQRPSTREALSELIRSVEDKFDAENLRIEKEIAEGGIITNAGLRKEFAGLAFTKKISAISRDLTTATGQQTAAETEESIPDRVRIREELSRAGREKMSVNSSSPLRIDSFLEYNGKQHIRNVRELAERLKKAGVKKGFSINATESGGGVAEMMPDIVALFRDAGMDMNWLVIDGYPEFYDVTVRIHEGLQSSKKDDLTEREIGIFDEVTIANFERLESEGYLKDTDFIFAEDPQTIGLIPLIKAFYPHIMVVWRCHIDASNPNKQIAEFASDMAAGIVRPDRDKALYEYIQNRTRKPLPAKGNKAMAADMTIFHIKEFASGMGIGEKGVPVYIMPPAINPFSYKNMPLPNDFIRATMEKYGLSADKFTFVEVSRFDPYKGPLEAMHAFARFVAENPGMEDRAQFVYAGNVAGDNLKGLRDLEKIKAYAEYIKTRYPALKKCMFVLKLEDSPGTVSFNEKQTIALLEGGERVAPFTKEEITKLTAININALEVNALQRQMDIVTKRGDVSKLSRKAAIQASSKEGFGLVVAEAAAKGTPVIAPAIGGIKTQLDEFKEFAPWLSLPYSEEDRDESLRVYEQMDVWQLKKQDFDLDSVFGSLDRRADNGFIRALSDAMERTYDFSQNGEGSRNYNWLGIKIKESVLDRFTILINCENRLNALAAVIGGMESSIAQENLNAFEKEWQALEVSDVPGLIAQFPHILGLDVTLDHEKPIYVFSEKVAFENRLVKCLPKLSEKGVRIAVIVKDGSRESALIDLLNEGLPEDEKIIKEPSLVYVRSNHPASKYYYFRMQGEENVLLRGVIAMPALTPDMVKKIIDAIGNACRVEPEKLPLLHEAARKFAESA